MKVVEGGTIVEKPTDGFGEIDFKGAARRSKAKVSYMNFFPLCLTGAGKK